MKITRRQLRRIIREAMVVEARPTNYDQLPYSMGGPWVDKDAPVGKGAKEYDDLDTELTDKEIEDAMGWEPATGNDALIDTLIFGWAQWADGNGRPDPGLFAVEEKGDAALSWVSKNEPDIARQINALSTHNLRALYDAAFDAEYVREAAGEQHRTGKGWKDPAPGEADSLWPKPGYGKDPTPQESYNYGYDDAMAGIPHQGSYDESYDSGYEDGLMDAQAQDKLRD